MVEYSTWVSIVFELAREEGLDLGFGENQNVVSVAADLWNDYKDDLREMAREEAKRFARRNLQIND